MKVKDFVERLCYGECCVLYRDFLERKIITEIAIIDEEEDEEYQEWVKNFGNYDIISIQTEFEIIYDKNTGNPLALTYIWLQIK